VGTWLVGVGTVGEGVADGVVQAASAKPITMIETSKREKKDFFKEFPILIEKITVRS